MKTFVYLILGFGSLWTVCAQATHDAPASTKQEPVFEGKPSWISDHDWLTLFDPPFTRPTEIPVDSDLRRALFEQLRSKVQKKTQVRFMGNLRAFKNWAIFRGEAWDANDKPIYASWSRKVKVEDDPLANDNVAGLWLRTRSGWKLVAYRDIGCGELDDPTTLYWADRYGMPEEFWGEYAAQTMKKERTISFAFPKRGDIPPGGLRKELFDLLRPEAERVYGKGIRFTGSFTGSLEGFKNWALFQGWTIGGTKVLADRGDTVGLWVYTCNGWLLVDFNFGHTDAFYERWKQEYGAPFFDRTLR